MPAHDPIQQLEPSNLLEPWEMADQRARPINQAHSARPEPVHTSSDIPPTAWHGDGRRRRFAMPILMLAGLLALGFGAGAVLPHLTRSLTGDRAAKVEPRPQPPSDTAGRGAAQAAKEGDSPARCGQQPNLDRQCRNDAAAASGDPSPPRFVSADRNADGSPRAKANATPPAPNAPAPAAAAPSAQAAAPTAKPGNPEAPQDTEQVSVPQRSEPRRERKARHHRHEETRHAGRQERREPQVVPLQPAPPNVQANADASDFTQSSQAGAEPKAEQRAERRSRDYSRPSRRHRDHGDDTRLSSPDRNDASRMSGRYRERGDEEQSADADEHRREGPSRSGNPFPFFPFFGQSW
jgi:hypothetical protein